MANELVQIVLRAKDEATAKIRVVNGELGALTKSSGRILGAAGPYGIIAGAALTAGAALVTMARSAVENADEQIRAMAAAGASATQIKAQRDRIAELNGELALAQVNWQGMTRAMQEQATGPANFILKWFNQLNREVPATGAYWRELIGNLTAGANAFDAIASAQAKWESLTERDNLGPTGATGVPTVENDPENERRGAARDAQRRARAAALREIEVRLQIGRAKAIEYQQALDRLTDLKARQKLGEAIFEATGDDVLTPLAKSTLGLTTPAPSRFPKRRMPAVDKPVAFDFEKRNAEIQKWLESMPKVQSDIAAIALEMKAANEQALSSLEITRGAFQAFEGGVHSGFSIVAANLNSEFQTIESAWKTMLNQMQAYYAEFLAQLAAKKLLTFLLGLVVGPVAAAGAEAFPIAPSGGAPRLPSFPDRARPAARQGGNTYVIYAFNTTDAIEQIQSGSLRQANDRVMVLRRAGQD